MLKLRSGGRGEINLQLQCIMLVVLIILVSFLTFCSRESTGVYRILARAESEGAIRWAIAHSKKD